METKLYLTRHLQRIDDGSDSSREFAVRWNTVDSKNPNFVINPYLSDFSDKYIQSVITKIPVPIDIIVSSPFLRCMQTALKIVNQLKKTGSSITNIYIDFGLSEFVDEYTFYNVPNSQINIQSVYDFSLSQFTPEDQAKFRIIDSSPQIINYESEEDYGLRIKSTLSDLYGRFVDKKILVISHAFSYQPFSGHELRYTDVFMIEPELFRHSESENTIPLVSSRYQKKYLKYKNKYLQLKKLNKV